MLYIYKYIYNHTFVYKHVYSQSMSYLRKAAERVLSAVRQRRVLSLALVFVEMPFLVFLSKGCVGVSSPAWLSAAKLSSISCY